MSSAIQLKAGDTADLECLSIPSLRRMSRAADEVLEALRVLGKAGTNPVAQVLRHQGEFIELDHYPKGDIYDDETGAQYYYHAHRPETGEHGHFHTFLRAKGMPFDIEPVPYTGGADRPLDDDAISHLIAIAMDSRGLPTALFTTNRWVTGETFYAADAVIAMLDRFNIDHAYPCLATNRWITAVVRLFRPQVEILLRRRDTAIEDWQRRYPDGDVFEDRRLEITSELPIDIDAQIAWVDVALETRTGASERVDRVLPE
ncbi:hypothetical protein [Hyphomicrobium sp. NDB2Meth4]|uniref:DUF6969 family protein n=1 Tax=Hyphomicrobium sp. NDB2Meth4 TaxID=1892846 RepID=UPI000931DC73|nr:hypothetical protein [Hyphomicrobium sp. NDB2Meth4]